MVTSLNDRSGPVRFAVVGAGHIAQNAVLPAFANARETCELSAIISEDPAKRAELSQMYHVAHTFDYHEFDRACSAGIFEAVYIALPNHLHAEYACRAAAAGIHVLCEKPMAITSPECAAMIAAARQSDVKLMIAYRLHFEEANMRAVEIARRGRLGELRLFSSVFSMQVREDNIRTEARKGGGPLFDLGIYCINAARYLFRDEPIEVTAYAAKGRDPRFSEVEEAVSAILRFPRERLAAFTCSFGAADVSQYQIVGTQGDLRVDPAYEYEGDLKYRLTIKGRSRERTYRKRDQFAPELTYFADCIRNDIEPEPGGMEGLVDVRIIEAIYESIDEGRSVLLEGLPHERKPDAGQQMHKPPPPRKRLVHAESAHRD